MSLISPEILAKYGISNVKEIVHNPTYEELYRYETEAGLEGFEKGELTNTGAVAVKTGIFTGRSPKDKYFVKDKTSENTLWWDGKINKSITPEIWDELKGLVDKRLSSVERLYVVDCYCGTNPDTRTLPMSLQSVPSFARNHIPGTRPSR